MSLGDSHRGFRVLGTTTDYFTRYKYRHGQPLAFAAGKPFADLFDVVIGADVASTLGYKVGDRIVVAHGVGSVSFVEHEDKPFQVSGILAKTGTPVDRTLHVSLEAIEAIHVDWQGGMPVPGQTISADEVRKMHLEPKAITAALVGLKSKLATFKLQRAINEYREEPLSAIIPGAALQELWGLVATAETALSVISAMVVATALLGMVTTILTTLNERRREMAILRSVGARPVDDPRSANDGSRFSHAVGCRAGRRSPLWSADRAPARRRPHLRAAAQHRRADGRRVADARRNRSRRRRGRPHPGAARLPVVARRRHDGQNMIGCER